MFPQAKSQHPLLHHSFFYVTFSWRFLWISAIYEFLMNGGLFRPQADWLNRSYVAEGATWKSYNRLFIGPGNLLDSCEELMKSMDIVFRTHTHTVFPFKLW